MPVVQLDLDSKDAVKGLDNYDKAVDKSERNTDSAFSRMKASIGGLVLVATATATAVAAAFATMGAKGLDSASRMQEAQNKYDVVFTGMSGQADAWRTNLEKNYNLSGLAATKYLANTKSILDATGMQSKAAGELSNNMVRMALDLASFADVPIADAIEATTAALTGEMEMMKRFGIVISADEVSRRAMIENHIRNASALTTAMKAQATYNIMLEKGAKAVGDVERSSASYVTQLNKLRALNDDVSTGMGQQLIPFATQASRIFLEWAGSNDAVATSSNAMNTTLKYTVETTRFLYNGFQGLVQIGNTVAIGIAYLTDTIVGMVQMTVGPLQALGDAMVKFGVLDVNPFENLIAGINTAREATEQFVASSQDAFNNQAKSIESANTAFDKLSESVDKQRVAQTNVAPAIDNTTSALNKSSDAANVHMGVVEKMAITYNNVGKDLSGIMEEVNGVWTQVAGATENLSTAMTKVKTASAGNFTEESAEQYLKYKSAVDSANKAVQDHAKVLEVDASPAEVKHHQALIALSDAAKKQMESFEKNGEVTKRLTKHHRDFGDSVEHNTGVFKTNFGAMSTMTDRAKSLVSAYNSGDASVQSLEQSHRVLSNMINNSTKAMSFSQDAAYRNAVAMDAEVVAVLNAAKAWAQYEKDLETFKKSGTGIGPTAPGSESAGYTGAVGIMKGSVDAKGGLTEEQWKSLPESVRNQLGQAALMGTQQYTMGLGLLPSQGGKEIVSLSKAINPEGEINFRAQQAYQFEQLQRGNDPTQTTNIYNFNQSVSRSDIENITTSTARNTARA